ncbi:hypothetical protein [Nocardioides deserti]|uniref:Transcriptional regulator, AbiEi antitoxin, Type IV TA system n=1 Tax=Nocardioides deserti TaxID=1588644 RepID=A0ABR6U8H9_9ACTN|nr:hypothetical protein [Nocardioides deserti]MBC2960673.1 hypothetical protein [Nocardioides deserti]
MLPPVVLPLLRRQSGVVARRQVLGGGGDDALLGRLLRGRHWARLHDGVYVDHTGPPSFEQRAWGAVLLHAPAVLAGATALRAYGVRTGAAPGHAPVEVAAGAPAADHAVAVLADACQTGRSTPARLRQALGGRPRLAGRRLLLEVLADVDAGAWSALERRYLVDVERAHGLPRGRRQQRAETAAGWVSRDVAYPTYDTLVELDGRFVHDRSSARWSDLSRDAAALAAGQVTVRLGWRHVLDPCSTAFSVAGVLATRGWDGAPVPYGDACRADDWGGPSARGAGGPPQSVA